MCTNIITKIGSNNSEKLKPAIVEMYNSNMHGVDKINQFRNLLFLYKI
jgi:hypothetical protein